MTRYLSCDQPYLSGDQSYLSGDQPYLSVDQPYLSSNQPYLSSNLPYLSSDQPYLSLHHLAVKSGRYGDGASLHLNTMGGHLDIQGDKWLLCTMILSVFIPAGIILVGKFVCWSLRYKFV